MTGTAGQVIETHNFEDLMGFGGGMGTDPGIHNGEVAVPFNAPPESHMDPPDPQNVKAKREPMNMLRPPVPGTDADYSGGHEQEPGSAGGPWSGGHMPHGAPIGGEAGMYSDNVVPKTTAPKLGPNDRAASVLAPQVSDLTPSLPRRSNEGKPGEGYGPGQSTGGFGESTSVSEYGRQVDENAKSGFGVAPTTALGRSDLAALNTKINSEKATIGTGAMIGATQSQRGMSQSEIDADEAGKQSSIQEAISGKEKKTKRIAGIH